MADQNDHPPEANARDEHEKSTKSNKPSIRDISDWNVEVRERQDTADSSTLEPAIQTARVSERSGCTSTKNWQRALRNAIISPGQPHGRREWLSFTIWTFVAVTWLVPAMTLLILNWRKYIVGAAAWCPTGHCPGLFAYQGDASQSVGVLLQSRNQSDHSLLAFLQYVARVVDLWYSVSAIGLIYNVAMLLARSEHGLPIGFIFAHALHSDIRYMIDPQFYRTASLINRKNPKNRRIARYYAFAGFVVVMWFISNLMGASVAIMMIPSVRWSTTAPIYESRFERMLSNVPPHGDVSVPKCDAGNLTAKNYACNWPQAWNLDVLSDFIGAQVWQNAQLPDNPQAENVKSPLLPEMALSIQFNVTALNESDGHSTFWAPNRQVVRQLSQDLDDYRKDLFDPNSRASEWSNSQTLVLQRKGPIVGLRYVLWAGNYTLIKIDEDRQIRCYSHWYYIDDVPVYKCLRAGTGWNGSADIYSFNVGSTASGQPDPSAYVIDTQSYLSDQAIYLTSLPACFTNSSCDWSSIFATPPPPGSPSNMIEHMANSLRVEHTVRSDTNYAMVVEAYLTMGFTLYTTDVSNASYLSTSGTVHISDLPDTSHPIAVDSSWYQLAWSVNNEAYIDWERSSARQLQTTIAAIYSDLTEKDYLDSNGADAWNFWYWAQFELYTLLQMASLLPWTSTSTSSNIISSSTHPAFNPGDESHTQPLLYTNARRRAWGYGIDSTSSRLGAVVICLGMVVVIARVVLALGSRIRGRSLTALLIAAMKHVPEGEFAAAGRNERKMARVRFEVMNDGDDGLLFRKR